MDMQNRIFELLPKTDCQKCGQGTCLVFASELAGRQVSIQECPDVSEEARRMLSQLLEAERDVLSALRGLTLENAKKTLSSAVMLPVRGLSLLIVTFPFLALAWLMFAWLFMK